MDIEEEIRLAHEAIKAGEDPAWVASEFQKRTGRELGSADIAGSKLSPAVGGTLDFLRAMALPVGAAINRAVPSPRIDPELGIRALHGGRDPEAELAKLYAREPTATTLGGLAGMAAGAPLVGGLRPTTWSMGPPRLGGGTSAMLPNALKSLARLSSGPTGTIMKWEALRRAFSGNKQP